MQSSRITGACVLTLLLETAAAGGSALATRAVQTPRWYSEYVNREAELYDLSNDPHEMRSIHADPSKAAVRAALRLRLRQTVVRVHSVLDDGREVTHDKRTPGCSRA